VKNGVAKSSGLDVSHPKDRIAKNGVAVLGCTLWSEATKEAYKGMNDRLKAILSHEELLKTHNEHKIWLKKTLKSLHKKGIKTIVVTHHLPLMKLTHPKYLKDEYKHLNSAYASNSEELITMFKAKESKNIMLYCCGHTHEKTETNLYGIDFIINPLGYPRENRETKFRNKCINI
jgi:pyridoxal/pyridoxine/pyridoxamine kinase